MPRNVARGVRNRRPKLPSFGTEPLCWNVCLHGGCGGEADIPATPAKQSRMTRSGLRDAVKTRRRKNASQSQCLVDCGNSAGFAALLLKAAYYGFRERSRRSGSFIFKLHACLTQRSNQRRKLPLVRRPAPHPSRVDRLADLLPALRAGSGEDAAGLRHRGGENPAVGSVAGFAGDIGAVQTRQDISTILQCGPSRRGRIGPTRGGQ